MNSLLAATVMCLFTVAQAQQVGKLIPEVQPKLDFQTCTRAGGCVKKHGTITVDANWRKIHAVNGTLQDECLPKNGAWDPKLCPDGLTCAMRCALEGIDYECTLGVTSTGDAVKLKLVTQTDEGKTVGSRHYLLNDQGKYHMFKLKNQELSFDIEMDLPCAINGAFYLVEMPEDGGAGPTNKAGSKYGTSYCDAQSGKYVRYINGKVNLEDWNAGSGTGKLGSTCNEMDIIELNTAAQAMTAHPCNTKGLVTCEGTACDSLCDKGGCDFNPYRLGARDFFGPNKAVDSTKKMTVVTQFLTHDGTSQGELVEIRRLYVQNGRVIKNTPTNLPSLKPFDSISNEFCNASKMIFSEPNDFQKKGGLAQMGEALERGMVLVMSLWDDSSATNMLWLDGRFPSTSLPSTPGVVRGPCTAAINATTVEASMPDTFVEFGNIRVGDINTTYPTLVFPGQ